MNINQIISAHAAIVSAYGDRVPQLHADHAELLAEAASLPITQWGYDFAYSYLMGAGEQIANDLNLNINLNDCRQD